MARRILVTGAKGFVGTYLRAALVARWPEAHVTSLVVGGDSGSGFVTADLLDATAIDAAVARAKPEIVIHLAAQASVTRSTADREAAFAVNLGGSLNLALAVARQAPEATLLFASTSEVYGASFLAGPVTETSPTLPLNDYAKSKWLAESMFAAILPPSARLVVARPFNHTGPGQREDFVLPSFAAQIARIEAGLQTQLHVGNLEVCRDFLDVRDVVDAYVALIDAAPTLPRHLGCNVASGEARPLRERIDTLCGLARVPIEIVVDPGRLRAIDVPVARGDASLLARMTDWRPRYPIETTLQGLLASARKAAKSERARPVTART